jgi:gamma-glutamyl:cysteine ligase YbdK (ATP-grasp superfamily)
MGGVLMPTAMHPWMDPHRETRLWPHEYSPVYESFNRIFGCQGHGWSNLQSTHVNLPFHDDDEFGRLHAAIRLVLPILPALAASSPIVEGRVTGLADSRLDAYRKNALRIPAVTGHVIPERAYSRGEYDALILQPLYRDLAPHDPDGILQYEWANARGAIARFDRNTIEIRVLDVQECPRADLAVLELIVRTLRALVDERWCSMEQQKRWEAEPLAAMLIDATRDAERAIIRDDAYASKLGLQNGGGRTMGDLWRHLFETLFNADEQASPAYEPLRVILERGTLARRILAAVGPSPTRGRIRETYAELCRCLADGRMLGGDV